MALQNKIWISIFFGGESKCRALPATDKIKLKIIEQSFEVHASRFPMALIKICSFRFYEWCQQKNKIPGVNSYKPGILS